MKKIICLLIFGCFITISFGQESEPNEQDSLTLSDLRTDALAYLGVSRPIGAVEFDVRYEGVKGHPYLYQNWYPASFKIANKKYQDDKAEFRVDLGKGEVQIRFSGSYNLSFPFDRFQKIWIDKGNVKIPFVTKVMSFQGQKPNTFLLEILHEGDFTFYKLHHKIFKQADYANSDSYADISTSDEFKSETAYYLSASDGRFEKIKLKKKSITKKFPELTQHFKQNLGKKKVGAIAQEEMIRLLNTL